MGQITADYDELRMGAEDLSQDREWCEVVINGRTRRIRFHDYHELYEIPGLYEGVFYESLRCCSPSRVVGLLQDVLEDFEESIEEMKVLDVGAGNGMVADELRHRGAAKAVGIDIIPEAKMAAYRDRPDVYEDYLVTDLTDLPEHHERSLRRQGLNCLTTVAALGFGDIPSKAFLKSLDLIDTPGWLAFNIKEDFLHHGDNSGFCALIEQLGRDKVIQIQAYQRYRHRTSTTGKPLHYVAVVARKLKDVPDEYLPQD